MPALKVLLSRGDKAADNLMGEFASISRKIQDGLHAVT